MLDIELINQQCILKHFMRQYIAILNTLLYFQNKKHHFLIIHHLHRFLLSVIKYAAV